MQGFTLGWIDITVFVAFVVAVISVGLIKSKGEEDCFLAGRGLKWWLIGFSLIAATSPQSSFAACPAAPPMAGVVALLTNAVTCGVLKYAVSGIDFLNRMASACSSTSSLWASPPSSNHWRNRLKSKVATRSARNRRESRATLFQYLWHFISCSGKEYMKRRNKRCFGDAAGSCISVVLLVFSILALVTNNYAQEICISPINGTSIYNVGDPASWSVSIESNGIPLNWNAEFSIKKGGLTVINRGELLIRNGTATVSAERNDPGALLLTVSCGNSTNYGGAVFDWQKILPSVAEPVDFDAFWQNKIAELQSVPMNAVLEKEEADADVDYWKITMDNIRGTRIYGQIAKPKNSNGPLPAMVQFQYAGVYPLKKEWVVNPAKEGWLALNIIAHDFPINCEDSFYKEQKDGVLNTYPAIGCEDRETSYFLRMYLSCYRAVDYLSQRPEWNGEVLLVTGTSQGGMQSVMTAGLHPAVTAMIAEVPAGCDLTGESIGRAAGWPSWSWSGREKAVAVSKYYDVVNFARRVKCPALVAAGAIDRVCPPEGVIAMYNQLKGFKRLIIFPVGGHRGDDGSHESFYEVSQVWRDALRCDRPLPEE